ncbi:hypothetical protein E1B28_011113 [Marasmius oreades]|uniref:Uncharacterized protein n=1 Tax=Marasmius oreades TaxID=181124 RepID=A0A9P7RTK9_9AGAR|nr:uncharacterized protein E1B28_011113 [Marasmius oreades]KAG7089427.1 hypothetical protein E1B28_011113 [Marasmius oreades]
MFKRVERKRKKREEEAALGLDEETKEVLGMHDTDSDESQSEIDSENEELANDGESDDEGGSALDNTYEDDDITEKLYPPIPLREALLDPLYTISQEPFLTGCLVCPGKILKSDDMLQQHRTSKAHERRFKRFKSLSEDADHDLNAWDIVDKLNDGNPPPQDRNQHSPELSKKKARNREFFKNRRAKRKAAAVAKKDAAKLKAPTHEISANSSEKSAKKQKMDGGTKTETTTRSSDVTAPAKGQVRAPKRSLDGKSRRPKRLLQKKRSTPIS